MRTPNLEFGNTAKEKRLALGFPPEALAVATGLRPTSISAVERLRPLRVLIVDGSPLDAELVVQELRRAGFDPEWSVVSTEAAYVAGLLPNLDVIVSDYTMPEFSGLRALELLHERRLPVPLIIVSDTSSADAAIVAMELGAVDCLAKSQLSRLEAAINLALEKRKRQDRERVERGLRECDEHFRQVVENIEDVCWISNREKTEIIFVSAAYEKIWGRTCASLYASPTGWLDTIHPEDRDRVFTSISTRQADGTFHEEYRIIRPDGSIRWIDDRAFPLRDAEGIVRRVAGVARDMTQRKLMGTALEASEKRLRDIIDGVAPSMLVGLLTPQGILIEANLPALATGGLHAEDVIGKPFEDTYWWSYSREIQEQLRETISRAALGEASRYDTRIHAAENEFIDIDFSLQPLRDEAGEVVFLIASGGIITERKQAEEELRWKTAFLEAQVDSSLDGVLVVDAQGRIILKNQRLADLWKIPAHIAAATDDAVMMEFARRRAKNPEQFLEKVSYLYSHPDEVSQDEIELVDGTVLDRYSSPVRDKAGKYYGRIWTFRDLTERKKLEQQFLRNQRVESIGTLASGIAHDLNNVLGPIMMSLELLHMKCTDPASQELISVIADSAQRGAAMVSQVLSFARGVEGEQLELQLAHIVREIEKIANDTFLKHVQVRTIVPHDLWTILGDPTQLHQVLLNLCVNARDAMPNGGQLTISAENLTMDAHYAGLMLEASPGPYVLLRVEDTGTGIPAEIIEKIFDPFFTTKEVGKGTGLGLSTTLGIVKSHSGFLRVYSEPDKGTTFKVYFPALPEGTSATVAETAAELPRGNGQLVLVVDDEATVREVTRQTLEAFGYRVALASDGAEAVAVFATKVGEVAAVLTDIMMPVMDGVAAIPILQRINSKVPIVAASGLGANRQVTQLANLGVKHFLAKPYTTEDLLKTLRQVLMTDPCPSISA